MKKLTLLTIGVFLAVLALAQNTNHQKYGENGYNYMPVPKIEKQSVSHTAKAIVWEENFDDANISDWTLYDQDGDGQDWFTATYDGIACLTSASWSSTGGALTPNNWAVTPAIDLSAVEGAPFIDFTTWAQDQGWTSEHYKVMVSTTDNQVASFTENIFEETLPGTGMFNRTVSLGDFVGETIYIAFVHFDCTDMFQLNLDDISVYSSIEVNLGVTGVASPTNAASCALSNAEEVTITLANVGGVDATGFDISYTIEGEGGTETVTETFDDVLAAGATTDYTFTQTADLSALDYYTITYEVAIADDVDLTNNTLEHEVRSTDGTLIVSALSDAAGDQTWTLTNSAGDVVASFTDYQWDIN
ncbi:MAG: choice-of-anchor J domain-containing protein [Salinivirgaceae bacterium]|jgi:hypothetical protein|nr:choice-of-anchor J domain-containing protein [Salinivirgaceae bacterium]